MRGLPSSHKAKLLADENVKAKLAKFLVEQGFDVKRAPKRAKDSELFSTATKEGRVLLTHDKDFLDAAKYPPKSCPGIILLSIHPPELSKLKSATLKLLREFPEDLRGKTLILREEGVTILE